MMIAVICYLTFRMKINPQTLNHIQNSHSYWCATSFLSLPSCSHRPQVVGEAKLIVAVLDVVVRAHIQSVIGIAWREVLQRIPLISDKSLLKTYQEDSCNPQKARWIKLPLQIKNATLYSVSELSQMLHVTPATIRHYLNQGKLRGKKAYGRWFITYEDLMGYIKGF